MIMNILSPKINTERKLKNLKHIAPAFINLEVSFHRRYLHDKKNKSYSKYYKVLELPDGADQDLVRRAFINLCKKYHPDSGGSCADASKFQEIENAYRCLQNKFAEERWNVNEGIGEYGLYYDPKKKKKEESEDVKIFDIKHNAPQHRQYLSFDGVGSGTPSQRERQYANYQRLNAIQNVYDHRVKKLSEESVGVEQALVAKSNQEAKKIKTRYGMDRIVEDLIQESMAKGEFDNLKGAGKPLPDSNYNPFIDFVTHKMNQVMIDNGFVPEWINLQREISEGVEAIKCMMVNERKKFGPNPISSSETNRWDIFLDKISHDVRLLNKKIDKFNLVVPILDKQMLHFNLKKESNEILNSGVCLDQNQSHIESEKISKADNKSIGDILSIFLGLR